MRLVKNKIELNGSGTVTLCPEEPEDMVHPFALMMPTINTNLTGQSI